MPHVKSNFAPHRDKFGNTLIEEGLPCPAEGYLHNNGFNGLHTLTGAKICKTMNLDLDNGEPIGRMDDRELWFRVWVKDPNEPFMIAVNGSGGSSYDWDISVDGAAPVRKTGNKSPTPISLPMTVGKHYVKITPHNGVTAGWARCLGSGEGDENYWNNSKEKLEFGLEWLPGYAFMESEDTVGNNFLNSARYGCTSLTSMPSGFNLPQGITSVEDYFLYATWKNCTSLTSIPNGFNIPQGITNIMGYFLNYAWEGCTSLTSMPSGFNLPQGITSVDTSFLYSTWEGCTSLTSMPSGFNLPQGITSVGNGFLNRTWEGCTSLTSMPSGFNLPQGITSVEGAFLWNTWNNCSSLTSDSPAEPINFPNVSLDEDLFYCFGGTCPIFPDHPSFGSSVMVHRG